MMQFKIGDLIWYAGVHCVEKKVLCPDCFGELALTIILGDGSKVSIECAGCAAGFEPPRGYCTYYSWQPEVKMVEVKSIEIKPEQVTYWTDKGYGVYGEDVFAIKEEAEARAKIKMEEHNKAEIEKICKKEKHNRTWAWNAHYHRDCIKRAEKDLAYHTAKLNVAKSKLKEEKISANGS